MPPKPAILLTLAVSVLLFFLGAATGSAELPPLFEGELGVCENVDGAMDGGQSLPDALLSNIQGLFSNDPAALESIRRTFIHEAITVCRYEAFLVIEAGYLAGLPIDLLIGSAIGAGVEKATVSAALLEAGADPQLIQAALEVGETPESVEVSLPSALSIGSGLGQVSPFTP